MSSAFKIRLARRLTQKIDWMPSFLRFSKNWKKTHYCEFRYFFKNHVNHAFLVGFGQNKAQKWKEQVHFRSRTSYFGGLRSFWSSKYGFFIILVAGQVTVTKEVWTYFTRQKPILVPDGPRPQRKTFLDIFWRAFIISGLYFAWNRPEMHFLRHFWVKIFQMPQKWSFFALNFHKQCNSGRFWEK